MTTIPKGMLNATTTAEPPVELALAIPPTPQNDEYVAIQDDTISDSPHSWFLLMKGKNGTRHLTEKEASQVASYMNEQGSNIITLYCRNDTCQHKGTWIRRASGDVKKNVYFCDGCKQPMVR